MEDAEFRPFLQPAPRIEIRGEESPMLFRGFSDDLVVELEEIDHINPADPFGLNKPLPRPSSSSAHERDDWFEIKEDDEPVEEYPPFESAGIVPKRSEPASWEKFAGSSSAKTVPTKFLSERPELFEAIVYENEDSVLIPMERFLSCLFNLALGRGSLMYKFSETKLAFKPISPTNVFRVPGCSAESVSGIVEFCRKSGSQLMRLKYTITTIQAMSSSPVLIAFADCLNMVVRAIESFSTPYNIHGIIQLHKSLQPAAKIVDLLTNLLGCGDISIPVRLNRLPKPWSLLNILYLRALVFESSDASLFQLTRLLLERTSASWLISLEDIIGLGHREIFWKAADYISNADSFVKPGHHLFELDEEKVPKFLDHSLAVLAVQTLNCFIILFLYGDKTLNETLYAFPKVKMQWCFDVASLYRIKHSIAQHEQRVYSLSSGSGGFGRNTTSHTSMTDASSSTSDMTQIEHQVDQLLKEMEHEPDEIPEDSIQQACKDILSQTTSHAPHQSEIPMVMSSSLSFGDAIGIQNQLANRLVLEMFQQPNELNLTSHTILVRQIYLLGCGKLVGDLEYVLFDDPTGLNMATREFWPPSASEINRTLSAVVEDATLSLQLTPSVQNGGHLNFGLAANVAVSDPRQLDSTDALRLCYNVPQPLTLIFSPRVCQLLDRIFARLLKLLFTMHHLKSKDKRGSRYFEAARHFIWAVASYFTNNVLDSLWTKLTAHHPDSLYGLIHHYHHGIRDLSRQMLMDDPQIENIMTRILAEQPFADDIRRFLTAHRIEQLDVMVNYNGYY